MNAIVSFNAMLSKSSKGGFSNEKNKKLKSRVREKG